MAGNLGPKPRMGAPTGGGLQQSGADGLQFYQPPGGAMQPQTFGQPVQQSQPVQPPAAVQPPCNFPPPQQPGNFPQPGAMMPPAGSMGQPVGGAMGPPGGSMGFGMQPGSFPGAAQSPSSYDDDIENEPPLLEELGINVEHIVLRMKGVALFKQIDQDVLEDADLSGPIAIIMTLGTCLLLAGKIQFGYLYGLGVSGCMSIWLLINVMSQKGGIDLYRTTSILGYGLIPIVVLAFFGIFLSLQSTFGTAVSALCILWATATSSRFFATAIAMDNQRWLVAYPVGLFYTCFTLLVAF
mmetsp:Transcript_15188/g.39114  ORF Transcript_15188/g.39114 Transcript_15188/m.39114 type:complete len:296 (-) Transcript_15188:100-987(-)